MTAQDDRSAKVRIWGFVLVAVVLAIAVAVFAYHRPTTDSTPIVSARTTAGGQPAGAG